MIILNGASYGGGGVLSRGVLPVQVKTPTAGSLFRFEQLLVIERSIKISADYKITNKTAKRRGEGGCCG